MQVDDKRGKFSCPRLLNSSVHLSAGWLQMQGYSLLEGTDFLPASLSFALHSTLSLIGEYRLCLVKDLEVGLSFVLTPNLAR
jgi:hypothetical protein